MDIHDIPAAHSMATDWFAVDRDGHVALFESGESGAVPVAVPPPNSLEERFGLQRQLAQLLPAGESVYDLEGRLMPGPLGAESEHWALVSYSGDVLLFLRSLEPIREEINSGQAVQFPAKRGVAVVFRDLDRGFARS